MNGLTIDGVVMAYKTLIHADQLACYVATPPQATVRKINDDTVTGKTNFSINIIIN